MGKFEQNKRSVQAIGGKRMSLVTHCATRMRFVLGDEKEGQC